MVCTHNAIHTWKINVVLDSKGLEKISLLEPSSDLLQSTVQYDNYMYNNNNNSNSNNNK